MKLRCYVFKFRGLRGTCYSMCDSVVDLWAYGRFLEAL